MLMLLQPMSGRSATPALLSDGRWRGMHGIGRFASEVLRRLPDHAILEGGPRPLSLLDPAWLACHIFARRPGVFFSPGFNPPPACPSPFVFTIHDLIQLQMPDSTILAKRLYYQLVLRPAARRAFRVLSVSDYSRQKIVEWSGLPEQRVVNVGNGVGAPFQAEGERYEPGFPYILYVGNFRPHKNLERLLAAFRDLDCPELRLLLTGNPTPRLIAQLGHLQSRTKFLGTPPDALLSSIYRGALFAILPSLMEGFGLPAVEAMACGTPVIASNRAALPEVVGDAGLLVDPLDVGGMTRAMERLLGDGELRSKMREAGLRRAERYSWDAVAARVRAVLEAALDAQ